MEKQLNNNVNQQELILGSYLCKPKIIFEIDQNRFLIEFNHSKNHLEALLNKKNFQNYFLSIYKNFTVKEESSSNFDLIINLINTSRFELINKGKKIYNLILYKKNKNQVFVPSYINIIQLDYIIKLLLAKLIKKIGFFIHSSSVAFNKQGYIFLGKPGSGKSTIIKLLKNLAEPINDDVTLIKKKNDNNFYIISTPFIEKEMWFQKKKSAYPIKALFLLKKSKYNRISRIKSFEDIFSKLTKQVWLYEKNTNHFKIYFGFLKRYQNSFYYFYFNKNKSQVENYFRNFLKNNSLD